MAQGSVRDGDMDLGKDTDGVITMFKVIHQSVEKMRERYLDEARRISYVTPTSYLELLNCYKIILKERKKEVGQAKERLAKGLNVLASASVEVAKLNKQLADAQPEMEKTMAFVAEKKEIVAKENKEAEAVKVVVAADEEVAAKEAAEVKAVKDSADADLAVALPALDEAVKKVKQINVNDFYELKGVGAPGPSIVACFKTVILYFPDVKKQVKKPPKTDEKMTGIDPEGYWTAAKGILLKDPKKFLRDLIDYDKDNIADSTIEAAQAMLDTDAMAEAKVKSASTALVAVRIWCKAMITYNTVLKIVGPKRALAAEKTIQLEKVMKSLNEKRAQVKAIDDKLAAYKKEINDLEAKAKQLNDDIEDCGKKLIRADKMIDGLSGEKERWTTTVA